MRSKSLHYYWSLSLVKMEKVIKVEDNYGVGLGAPPITVSNSPLLLFPFFTCKNRKYINEYMGKEKVIFPT